MATLADSISDCPNRPTVLSVQKDRSDRRDREMGSSMSNSHAELKLSGDRPPWQPVRPPKRGQDRRAFNIFMMLPGLSISFYAAALGKSRSSVSVYRAAARDAALADPAIMAGVRAAIWDMSREDGLQMARLRGQAHLPSWSRLAIGDYRKQGFTRREIAKAFRCSLGTVTNVLLGKGGAYSLFSGEHRLTNAQLNPPGKWRGATNQ